MRQKKLSGKALVIQLGRDELRVALTTLGAAPKMQQCMTLPVPQGAVEDGVIQNPDILRDTLKAALSAPEYRRRKRVVFSICSTQIIPETVTVPAVSPKKMEKLLGSNMDLYFPVDAREYRLVWKTIGPAGSGEGGQEVSVQLWAVPNTLLVGYYALANSCGLSVAAIDYCGTSLAAAVGASFTAAPKAAGAGRARRVKKQRSDGRRSLRGQPGEAEPFTATAVMDPPEVQAGPDFPDTQLYLLAEREYLMMTFVQAGQVKLQRLLLCGSDPESVLSEALMVLEYYGSLEAGRYSEISGVLCGALADDVMFEQAVRDMLNLPVRVLDCGQGPAWCVCLGASRMALDFGVPTMNQRGGASRQLAQAWQYGLVLVGGALLAASLLLTFGSRVNWQVTLDGLNANVKSLELQAAQNGGNKQRYDTYKAAYDSYGRDWDALLGTDTQPGALRTYNDNLVLALEELEKTLPKTTRVVTIGIAQQGLGLQLACESKEDVAYTIIQLRNLDYATLASISNMSYGAGLDARQVISSLTGGSEADLAAALGGSAGTGESANDQQPTAEAAPTEGSQLDVSSLLGLLQQSSDYKGLLESALASGTISREDLEDALDRLDPEQLAILEAIYGKHTTSYSLRELLLEATFDQREAALRKMLTSDPVAMSRFAMLMKEDMAREPKDQYLFSLIFMDLLKNWDTFSGVANGDVTAIQQALPALLDILTQDEETLSATEDLMMTDETVSKRLAYYLAVEMGWQDETGGSDNIDVDDLLNDIIHGTLPDTPDRNDAADILAGMLPDLVPDLPNLIPGVSGSNDQQVQDWLKDYLTGGQGATETWDVVWTLLDSEDLGPGVAIDPSENAEYSLDDKYYITVALKYKEELIQAELERKGLSRGDKVAELEVG